MTTATSKPVVRFFLPHEPMPAPRTKCACRGSGRRVFPTIYNPADYTVWKADAAKLIAETLPAEVVHAYDRERDVIFGAEFVVTPPKTTKLRRPKPDLDNYLKAVQDAITESGVLWRDDTLVAEYAPGSRKRWATPGEPPGTYVSIFYADE